MPVTSPDVLGDLYIRSQLVADDDLFALVGERVYEGAASGTLPDYPLVTFQMLTGEGVSRKVGGGAWFKAEPQYRVAFYATDETDLIAGIGRVIAALDGARATVGGSAISSHFMANLRVNAEEIGSGQAIYGKAVRIKLFIPAPV